MLVVVGRRTTVALSGVTGFTGREFRSAGVLDCSVYRASRRAVVLLERDAPATRSRDDCATPFRDYIARALAASVARLSTTLGNRPIQNIPAMQTQAANLTGPDKGMGDKSGAFLLQ